MRAARATLAVLVVLLAGCGGGGPEPGGAGLSDAEIEWAGGYAAWSEDLGTELEREAEARTAVLGEPGGLEQYTAATARLRDCRSLLEKRLGDPPTARLGGTYADLQGVCDLVVTAVAALVEVSDPAERTEPFVDVEHATSSAYYEWRRIDDALEGFSLARGPLPEAGGDVSHSRVEPALTAVAARVADGRSVEVRCWDPDDWHRVLREAKALTNGELTIDSVGAFALTVTGTLHLQQVHCGQLVRVGGTGLSGTGLDALSFAVGLFSHEIQHVVGPDQGEAETECAAVQHLAKVAIELGASPGHARELADYYWEEIYPTGEDEYRSNECRPGGAFDLAPATPAWPTG